MRERGSVAGALIQAVACLAFVSTKHTWIWAFQLANREAGQVSVTPDRKMWVKDGGKWVDYCVQHSGAWLEMQGRRFIGNYAWMSVRIAGEML